MHHPTTRPALERLKKTRRARQHRRRGMTLLELTVVILVLLSLITILFIGARGWKRGSDRSLCVLNIQAVQKGVRSYSNMYGFSENGNAPGLKDQIVGLGRFVESIPACPAGGTYNYGSTFGIDTIPPTGELYMRCTLETTEDHAPKEHDDW